MLAWLISLDLKYKLMKNNDEVKKQQQCQIATFQMDLQCKTMSNLLIEW